LIGEDPDRRLPCPGEEGASDKNDQIKFAVSVTGDEICCPHRCFEALLVSIHQNRDDSRLPGLL
jgi:hypothetical protein